MGGEGEHSAGAGGYNNMFANFMAVHLALSKILLTGIVLCRVSQNPVLILSMEVNF